MIKDIIVVGAFQETIELCEEASFNVVGIIDNQLKGAYCGIPIIGTDNDAFQLYNKYKACGIVIAPDNPRLKEKLMKIYESVGFCFPSIVSPFAHISKSSIIDEGVIIQAGVNVSSNAKIGKMVKLNYNVNVMHDVQIEDYCILAPSVVLLGRSKVLSFSYIGANTTVLPDVCISSHSNIKPCSIVYEDGNKE